MNSGLPHVLARVIRTRVLLTGEHEVNEWPHPSHVTENECPTGGVLRSPFGEPHTHFEVISLYSVSLYSVNRSETVHGLASDGKL